VLGGVLAPISWRLIFLVSVPVGLFGSFWSYRSLRDIGERHAARIDWWGNLTLCRRADRGDGRDHQRDPALPPTTR